MALEALAEPSKIQSNGLKTLAEIKEATAFLSIDVAKGGVEFAWVGKYLHKNYLKYKIEVN